MTIKAVFFDMGGTLETFGFTRALRLEAIPGMHSLLREVGVEFKTTDEELLDFILRGWKRYHDLSLQSQVEYSTFRVWSEFILQDIAYDRERLVQLSEELMFYFETRFYNRCMRPEIPAVLDALRGMGLRIGLISNVNSRGQVMDSLEKYGLQEYFYPVVCSSEFGRRKPDPAIFHYAARLADTPASQCLYVGDRIARDVLGARRAGFRLAVQIRHDFAHGEEDEGPVPDVIIEDMRELVEIIRQENEVPQTVPAGEIRAYVFDAGDILYYRPEKGRQFAEFLGAHGLRPNPELLRELEPLAFRAYRGLVSQEEYRRSLLERYGLTAPEEIACGLQALQDDEDNVTFFVGVKETLHQLKQAGYLLGIITDTANSISSKLRWFEKGGFGEVWDAIISSAEFGVRKPDAILYQAMLRQLGLRGEQVIFVGHKAVELDGARSVGMKTVAFNWEPDAQAEISIEEFSELVHVPSRFEVAAGIQK